MRPALEAGLMLLDDIANPSMQPLLDVRPNSLSLLFQPLLCFTPKMAVAFHFFGGTALFDRTFRRSAAGSLLFLPGLLLAYAQPRDTHHYELRDPALAHAAQRYDWAQEGKGNRPELEKLVADNYELVRASGKVTNKAGLIDLICHPGSYTNPYTVAAPFVRDLGDTVILGGWVRITGTDGGKPFEQKARFADIWHKGEKSWQLSYTQVTLADHP